MHADTRFKFKLLFVRAISRDARPWSRDFCLIATSWMMKISYTARMDFFRPAVSLCRWCIRFLSVCYVIIIPRCIGWKNYTCLKLVKFLGYTFVYDFSTWRSLYTLMNNQFACKPNNINYCTTYVNICKYLLECRSFSYMGAFSSVLLSVDNCLKVKTNQRRIHVKSKEENQNRELTIYKSSV